MKKFGNAYLVDRLRDRAEILQDGRAPAAGLRAKFGAIKFDLG